MVRGHGAAGLGDHRRVRQAVFVTGIADTPNHVVGVFVQAVVHRAVGLRAGAFVVDAQAAAHVEALNVDAQLVQFNVKARRFAHAGGDIANVGQLRAQVEMQQLQAVETARFAQGFHQLQHLHRRQTELGFFAAARLPFAGALRRQARTHAQARHHVQPLSLFQHQVDLGHLLDHQVHLVPQFFSDQRQANIFTIFIAVTDDHRAGHAGMRQHRHQLGLGAGFQPQRFAGVHQRLNHAAMLVHLDRIHQEIAALVTERLTRAFERGVDRTQAMLKDLREAEQRRQTLAVLLARFHQFCQIDARLRDIRVRAHADMAQLVDVIVIVAPVGDVISTQHLAGITIIHGNLLHGAQR